MQSDELKRRISAGRGDALADLVLKNARIVNVFIDEIDTADIAISGNLIVGVGTYHGRKEVDLHGKYVCPGLIDGHIHIESSMLCGPAFEQAVLPHGTTAVITDPHEISNVAGLEGLDFMLETTKNLTLSVYFMLPSCVPATDLDESGAVLNAEQLRPYYGSPRVLGLAELMNAYGTVRCDPKILQKIRDCTEAGKIVDGHAPLLSAKDLNAYIAAGVQSDHECSNIEEAMEKFRLGQYIMIREGTAAKNMEALMPLFREPYCSRCMLVTDDKHPGDLLDNGHIDSNIRKAIRLGADPAVAVKMATLVPAQYFGFKQRGAVAPGYRADLVVDFLILNRDRHGANIEVLRNSKQKTLRLAPVFDHGLSLLFNCNSETAVKKFDVMADRPVQCFVGSSSAQQNLTLIPREKLPCLQPLNESHKKDILTGLDEIIPGYLSEKIWDMIWQRWLYYEDFCNKK